MNTVKKIIRRFLFAFASFITLVAVLFMLTVFGVINMFSVNDKTTVKETVCVQETGECTTTVTHK